MECKLIDESYAENKNNMEVLYKLKLLLKKFVQLRFERRKS